MTSQVQAAQTLRCIRTVDRVIIQMSTVNGWSIAVAVVMVHALQDPLSAQNTLKSVLFFIKPPKKGCPSVRQEGAEEKDSVTT